jgi:hypothetical protein
MTRRRPQSRNLRRTHRNPGLDAHRPLRRRKAFLSWRGEDFLYDFKGGALRAPPGRRLRALASSRPRPRGRPSHHEPPRSPQHSRSPPESLRPARSRQEPARGAAPPGRRPAPLGSRGCGAPPRCSRRVQPGRRARPPAPRNTRSASLLLLSEWAIYLSQVARRGGQPTLGQGESSAGRRVARARGRDASPEADVYIAHVLRPRSVGKGAARSLTGGVSVVGGVGGVAGAGWSLGGGGCRSARPLVWAAFGIAELGGGWGSVVGVGGRGPRRSGPERVDRVECALEDLAVAEAGGRAEDHASAGADNPRGDREQEVA